MPPHTKGFSCAVEEPWPPGTGAAFAPTLVEKEEIQCTSREGNRRMLLFKNFKSAQRQDTSGDRSTQYK